MCSSTLILIIAAQIIFLTKKPNKQTTTTTNIRHLSGLSFERANIMHKYVMYSQQIGGSEPIAHTYFLLEHSLINPPGELKKIGLTPLFFF